MKKCLLFIGLMLGMFYGKAQKVDTSYRYFFDTISHTYQNYATGVIYKTYDLECNLHQEIGTYRANANSPFKNDYRLTYSYTTDNLMLDKLNEYWDDNTNSWTKILYEKHFYNNINNLEDSMVYQTWNNNAWRNSIRYIYNHNANKSVSDFYVNGWDYTINQWHESEHIFNSYDTTNNLTSVLEFDYRNNGWEKYQTQKLTNTSYGKVLTDSGFVWSQDSMKWYIDFIEHFTYDTNHLVTSQIFDNWDTSIANTVIHNVKYLYINSSGGINTNMIQLNWNFHTNRYDTNAMDIFHYNNCKPLPLKLLSFTAQKENNHVLLNWQTTNEVNVSHINIQRSTNNNEFITIGKVNSSCCSYSFTDNSPLSTVNSGLSTIYYRLEIIDKDGSKTYSEIRNVEFGIRTLGIRIYPNPAKEFVTIACKDAKQLFIIDDLGKTVFQSTVNSQPLNVINIKQLNRGIYVVKAFMNNGEIKIVKLVVE